VKAAKTTLVIPAIQAAALYYFAGSQQSLPFNDGSSLYGSTSPLWCDRTTPSTMNVTGAGIDPFDMGIF